MSYLENDDEIFFRNNFKLKHCTVNLDQWIRTFYFILLEKNAIFKKINKTSSKQKKNKLKLGENLKLKKLKKKNLPQLFYLFLGIEKM